MCGDDTQILHCFIEKTWILKFEGAPGTSLLQTPRDNCTCQRSDLAKPTRTVLQGLS